MHTDLWYVEVGWCAAAGALYGPETVDLRSGLSASFSDSTTLVNVIVCTTECRLGEGGGMGRGEALG